MHPAEEVLDAYALNRLTESELGAVEEHLLVCEYCRAEVVLVTGIAVALRDVRAACN